MKNFIFDIQRFDELEKVMFSGTVASVSANVSVNDSILTGSSNDDTVLSSGINNGTVGSIISVGGGHDLVNIIGNSDWRNISYNVSLTTGIYHTVVTIDCVADNDTLNITGFYRGITNSTVSVEGGDGADTICKRH